MNFPSPATFIALALAAALGAWAVLRLQAWRDKRRRQRIARTAMRGEDRARAWLQRDGFTILGEQEQRFCTMQIDGNTIEYFVRADFVVERDGQRAVVEVKTGSVALKPSGPQTRRQMFEYASVFGVEQVFMFDGDAGRLFAITFHGVPRRMSRRERFAEWQLGFACGVGVAALALVAWRIW